MLRRTVLALPFATLLRAAQIPRSAPNFAGKLANGQDILLSQYKGKVVALAYVITTCPHCQNCSRILQKMSKEYGARGFQPLAVATDEMAHILIDDFAKDLSLTFPVGHASRETSCQFLQHPMELRMLVPQLVFIDRKGVIRAQYAGDDKFFLNEENNMRAQIETLLKEKSS